MTATPQRGPKVPKSIGELAGQFLLTLALFALAGLGWGAWRPSMTGTIAQDGAVDITDPTVLNSNREFATFGVMVLCFLALGLGLAIYSSAKHRAHLGIGLLLWGAFSTAIGSVVFHFLGTQLALYRVGVPDIDQFEVGSTFDYLPSVPLSVGILVAPMAYLITFWCLAVFQRDEHAPNRGDQEELSGDHANVSG